MIYSLTEKTDIKQVCTINCDESDRKYMGAMGVHGRGPDLAMGHRGGLWGNTKLRMRMVT